MVGFIGLWVIIKKKKKGYALTLLTSFLERKAKGPPERSIKIKSLLCNIYFLRYTFEDFKGLKFYL